MPNVATITRTGHSATNPAEILAVVQSTDGFTTINPHLDADPKLRIRPFGPARGIGAGFTFQGKNGKGTQTVTAIGVDYVEYRIDMGFLGVSTQRITAAGSSRGGSDIEWSTRFQPGLNPLQHIFALFAERVLGPTIRMGVDNLSATPQR